MAQIRVRGGAASVFWAWTGFVVRTAAHRCAEDSGFCTRQPVTFRPSARSAEPEEPPRPWSSSAVPAAAEAEGSAGQHAPTVRRRSVVFWFCPRSVTAAFAGDPDRSRAKRDAPDVEGRRWRKTVIQPVNPR